MKNKIFIAAIIGSFLFSCEKKENQPTTKVESTPEKVVTVPSFSEDSAFKFIENQVSFGPRVPNSPAHRKTANYLEEKLKEFGANVTVQAFEAKAYDGTMLNLRNIIGSYNPKASKRIMLAAHWDSRPFADQDSVNRRKPIDGANDGGSGVGVLLELAKVIHDAKVKPDVGVDIFFFDGEDYGQPDFDKENGRVEDSWCLGSQYWAKNKHVPGYSAYYGILLDMVGGKNARFAMEGTSMHYAPSIVQKVWKAAHNAGFGEAFVYVEAPGIIDDHSYINDLANIPTIDIIEFNGTNDRYFGEYWHTHNDNMDVISRGTLKAVGQTLLEVLYRE
jgi:hypothetical protein